MEATGVVFRQPLRLPSSCGGVLPDSRELGFPSATTNSLGPRRRASIGIKSSGFRDQGHVRYYNSVAAASSSSMAATDTKKEKKTMKDDKAAKKLKKKQLKLLKGLFRDLTNFSHMSFGLESDGALLDQVKGNMISEASELLLKQLEKLKAEEKQLKRKRKEEKARSKAAARCQTRNGDSSSSSSESSSSDSECGEIVDMNDLKKQVIEEATTLAYPVPISQTFVVTVAEPNGLEEVRPSSSNNAENESPENGCLKKIEVCMGGKCKKSGASALLEEFQRAIGVEGAVSGCKCMGKCRDGPNVKVVSDEVVDGALADKSVRALGGNSLCIGVGLEDVDMIVGNFFGGTGKDNHIGFVAAC